MLGSRSYNAAVRTLSVPIIQLRPSASNEFISIAPQKLDEEQKKSLDDPASPVEKQHILWPRDLRILAVKDNIATSELPTTCGSSILKQHQSPFEATVVGQFRQFGASVIGKANLDEFGMGSHSTNSFFGPVRDDSPHGRSVGGSSGGSAVAVAKGEAQFALGTDTGGSVRLPAAYTGIVGFKPSYGLISRWGVVPYANSLDTVGILVPGSKLLTDILRNIRHHDPRDPTSVTSSAWQRMRRRAPAQSPAPRIHATHFANFKIGVPVEYNIEELDPGVRQAWTDALALLQEKGCTIVPISLPNTKHALSAYYVLAPAEAASNLSKYDGVRYGSRNVPTDGAGDVLYSETRGDGFGDEVKRRILLGSYTLSSTAINNYFIKAQKVRRLVQRDFDRVFSVPNPLHLPQQFDLSDMDESILLDNKLGPSQVDMILCPTAPTPPPTIDEVSKQSTVDTYMNDVFTVPASLAGLPALSLPCPIPKQQQQPGTPGFAGIQIIGQYGDDFRVIETAKKLERLLYPPNGLSPIAHNKKHLTSSPRLVKSPASRKRLVRKFPVSKHEIRDRVTFDYEGRIRLWGGNGPWKKAVITKFPTSKGQIKPRHPITDKEVTKQLEETLASWSPVTTHRD